MLFGGGMLNSCEKEIIGLYEKIRDVIESRMKEFKENGMDKKKVLKEFMFCLLTPQSKAKICWEAVERLEEQNLLLNGEEREIKEYLAGVRFKNNKSRYIVENRKYFINKEIYKVLSYPPSIAREWLVKNIKGYGYKESSHFLRNIGKGEDLAILDRHILKNLKRCRIINSIPKTLTKNKYMEIEQKMSEFSKKLNIPLSHLDLVLWYRETGEVFK